MKYIKTDFNANNTLQDSALKTGVERLFYIVFAFAFTIVIGGIIYGNQRYEIIPPLIIPLILLFLMVVKYISVILNRFSDFTERHYNAILIGFLGIMLAINIITGLILRYEPIFDLGAIFTGASEWLVSGTFMENLNETIDLNYFYYFPNNFGGITILYIAFQIASWIGVADYYAIAMVANGLLATLAMLLTILVCKRLFGVKKSIWVLLLFLLSPPFYIMAAVFYTDSLSLIFPVLTFYLYLRFMAATATKEKLIWAILAGLAVAVGMLVKFTVVIVLFAIIIYEICSRRLKTALLLTTCSGLIIVLMFTGFNEYFYSNHIDKDTAKELNTPYSHWVMMSLRGSGSYNPEDYEFTRSFHIPEERNAAIRKEILARVNDLGFKGLANLFYIKGITSFGDGTYAQSDFLDDNPVHDTALHKMVLYDGEHYDIYRYISSGVYFGIQVFMLIGAYGYVFQSKKRGSCFIPQLCVFGAMVFLLFWEVTGRYVTNYIPMMMISAISGIEMIFE